jgi:hypothetical protein
MRGIPKFLFVDAFFCGSPATPRFTGFARPSPVSRITLSEGSFGRTSARRISECRALRHARAAGGTHRSAGASHDNARLSTAGTPFTSCPASSKRHSHPGCACHRQQAGSLCHLPASAANGNRGAPVSSSKSTEGVPPPISPRTRLNPAFQVEARTASA